MNERGGADLGAYLAVLSADTTARPLRVEEVYVKLAGDGRSVNLRGRAVVGQFQIQRIEAP